MLHLNSGKDYRFGGRKDSRTYFYPLTAENEKAVNAMFDFVAGTSSYKSGNVEVVQGRQIRVGKFAKWAFPRGLMDSGVCEFDFAELCKKPTGASDYISLCRRKGGDGR